MGYKIAIDGPSGCGKGYAAYEISKKLKCMYVDTGAMYRAFGLYCENNNVNLDDEQSVITALNDAKIDFVYDNDTLKILLNGVDVSQTIRTEQVGRLATIVSAMPLVRQNMIKRQRELAGEHNIVMEGRDIGSVVFPNAELKIFLTATPEVRAERRYNELVSKKHKVTYEEVLENIKRRDISDLTRPISPLIKMNDMIEIDTTYLNRQQVVDTILQLVEQKGLVKN